MVILVVLIHGKLPDLNDHGVTCIDWRPTAGESPSAEREGEIIKERKEEDEDCDKEMSHFEKIIDVKKRYRSRWVAVEIYRE